MSLYSATFSSPIGQIIIKSSTRGLRSLSISNTQKKNKIDKELQGVVQQLRAYFERKRNTFDVQLDWNNTAEFDQSVWEYLLSIPYGKTVSYSQVANAIGNPKAVRAVGAANARNPIAIIVPCHRVIGKSGHLTGYAGGLDVKEKLLQLEKPLEFGIQHSLF